MAVISFELKKSEPYAGGRAFGEVGPYQKLDGVLTFAVDPHAAGNDAITDIDLAPKDAAGRVRFRSDVSLLTPADPGNRNGRLIVELTNRGRKLFGRLNGATDGNPGNGFLMRHGWSIASLGWQWDVLRRGELLGFDAPPVLVDGLPATGPNIVTIRPNFLERTSLLANRLHDTYAAASLDQEGAKLLVRDHELGEDQLIPAEQWSFARETADGAVVPSPQHVYLESGFEPGKTYNLVYTATGARVVGAGLLAFRDAGAFLRQPSPAHSLPGFDWLYGFGVSQTGRMLRHFLYLGLNVDETGKQVYDGLLVHVAGARRGEFNHRFGQPSVQLTPGVGNTFPFADDETTDPYSERVGGLLSRQRALGGVPRIFYTNSSAEYWRGDGALVHVDPTGEDDLEPTPETRIYHFAGTQHVSGTLPQSDRNVTEGTRGRYGFNVIDYSPLQRAALVNLDRWASTGVEPPASVHPRLDDGTLVEEAAVLGKIAAIPGASNPDPAHLWGVREIDVGTDGGQYPAKLGRAYPRLVAAVDSDFNEVGGIRLPDLTVPIATHTGWNPRHPETGAPEQIIPMMGTTRFFAATASDRVVTADPRPSIQERYATRDDYLALVRSEAERLAAGAYVLDEDIETLVANAGDRYDAALHPG